MIIFKTRVRAHMLQDLHRPWWGIEILSRWLELKRVVRARDTHLGLMNVQVET